MQQAEYLLRIPMEKHDDLLFKQLQQAAYVYDGCGNRLLIVHLTHGFNPNDATLRNHLTYLGKSYQTDSVLVLTGNPSYILQQGYHVTMDVFEPRGKDRRHPELTGTWSTMCGNGVRAVARYLLDKGLLSVFIQTRSGNRNIAILPHNQFRVCMGEFTTDAHDLQRYVRGDVTKLFRHQKNVDIANFIFGLNGTREHGIIDGEPHLVVFLNNSLPSVEALMKLCTIVAPAITTNRSYFPQDINTSLVILGEQDGKTQSVIACTFERGVEYVTGSCGTAATVIGSYLLSHNKNIEQVRVQMPGGILTIESDPQNRYYMTGPANPVV